MLFAAMAMGAPAANATVDWLVNINDTGFEPTPAGGTIGYAVSVTNNGFTDAAPTTISLDIPAGGRLISFSGAITGCAPSPSNGPSTVVCNVPALPAGQSAAMVANVRSSSQGTLTLAGSVPVAGDSEPSNNSADQTTTITAGANLRLTVSAPATASSGSFVTLDYTVENLGPNISLSFTFSFPVPSGLTNFSLPGGCSLSGGVITCSFSNSLAVNGTFAFSLTGQVSAAGTSNITAIASLTSSSPADPIASNNSASANIAVTGGTDVTIGMSLAPSSTLLVGDAATFSINASYTGDSPNGLTIRDTIPSNYSITSVTPAAGSGWNCTVAGQAISCNRASGAGPGANISLGSIDILTEVISAGSATNRATIAATGPAESNLANNEASVAATFTNPVVDFRANKSGPNDPALVVVGNTYDYVISASNDGNAGFIGTVNMTDTLPAGLEVTSFNENGWSCTPSVPVTGPTTFVCSRDYTAGSPLLPGQTTPEVTMSALVTAAGTLNNAVAVASPNANFADNNAANNSATYSVQSSAGGASANLSLSKSASLATLPSGAVQTFTLELINAGPSTATNVRLTDSLTPLINDAVGATGAGFISSTVVNNVATGSSCSSASGGGFSRFMTCDFATIPVCTAGTNCPIVTIRVRPGGDAGGRTNSARAISSTTADSNLGNNSGSVDYDVEARADVTVSKVASPDPAIAGQDLTYVIAATNIANGLSAAENVTVTDTLPANLIFVSASPASGSCSATPTANSTTAAGNNQVICNLGTIANGAQTTLSIVVRPRTATRGTSIGNGVTVSTTTLGDSAGNNSDTIATAVGSPVLDLIVDNNDTDSLAVGDTMQYILTVTNAGPSAAENVVLNDVLPPARLSYQSLAITGAGTCGTVPAVNEIGGTLQCSFGIMAAGESRIVTVNMIATAKGVTSHTATINSTEIAAGFDLIARNNSDFEQTTIRSRADIEVVSKIPSVTTPSIRDDFNFVVRVRNNVAVGLSDADDVVLTDNLPAGMVLAGPVTASVVSGTASQNVCTGGAGDSSFTCDFGSMDNGALVDVTIPVEIISVSSGSQSFLNTASVTTSSLDIVPGNNSNSGSVTVESSSIAGTVFRDFADDGTLTGGDTGVGGLQITLTGRSFDNAPITLTVETEADGTYLFPFVPQGNYALTRAVPAEPNLANGTNTPGTASGTVVSAVRIGSIALPANTAATGYDFALIPTARIGIAKTFINPSTNADSSFNVTYVLDVENFSVEDLNDVTVTDALAGASPAFGTLATLTDPANDPMADGTYAMLAAPTGTCGGLNAGYNGSTARSVASAFTLAQSTTCSIQFTVRIQPTSPLPPIVSGGRYLNQARVTGVGAISGQSSPTNPQLADLSDNGVTADSNGNGRANEAGENDPTPISPDILPAIALVKGGVFADENGDGAAEVGETISFTFAVRNTGNVILRNVTVTDPLITVTGGPIANLAPGATNTTIFKGTYVLTAADVAAGQVVNTATARGNSAGGPVFDTSDSDDPADGPVPGSFASGPDNDDPTIVTYAPKEIDANDDTETGLVGLPGIADVLNIFDNDNLAGAPATPANVSVTVDAANPVPPELTFDPTTGIVGVAPGTPAGVYDFTYTICSIADPAVCSTAVVTITTVDPVATLSGTVFNDPNGNGIYDGNERDAGAGYKVELYNAAGVLVLSTTTNADGFYSLQVPPGQDYKLVFKTASGRAIGGIVNIDVAPGASIVNQNQPIDPAGVVYNSVTRVPVPGVIVTITSASGAPLPVACLIDASQQNQVTDATGQYNFDLIPGADPACPLAQTEYRLTVQNPATFKPGISSLLPSRPGTLDVAACPVDSLPGGSCQVSGSGRAPAPGANAVYFLSFLLGAGSPDLVNNHLPIDPLVAAAPDKFSKTANKGSIRRGDSVIYTIEATGVDALRVNIIDIMPAGFSFVAGSATVNDAAFVPVSKGRNLSFNDLPPDVNQKVVIKLRLVATAAVSTGAHVNRARIFDPGTGETLSEASATVQVLPEHVFDCSDIIGKVFDDKNRNGYQDEGEAGLPGVRVVTVKGHLITTDKFGRFHVACGELPDPDIGSNFIMKLDTRTLPTGYRITTENPRTVRVTAGKVTKVNFGAAITRVVKLDLNNRVFVGETDELKSKWVNDLDKVIELLDASPSVLRINFYAGSDSDALAKHRVSALRRLITERWGGVRGRYKLPIEIRIVRPEGVPSK